MLTWPNRSLSELDEPDTALANLLAESGTSHYIVKIRGTKKEAIAPDTMTTIVQTVLKKSNQPVLVHCNHGKVGSCARELLVLTDRACWRLGVERDWVQPSDASPS